MTPQQQQALAQLLRGTGGGLLSSALTNNTGGQLMPTNLEDGGFIPPTPEADDAETQAPQTFTFAAGIETGDRAADSSFYGQTSEAQTVTSDDLRNYFESDGAQMLNRAFGGDFDKYLAYMTEREQLIQDGEYDVGSWGDSSSLSEDERDILDDDMDVWVGEDDEGNIDAELFAQRLSDQKAAYNNWINSDANEALLEKYGINGSMADGSGDIYRFNGSSYSRTQKADSLGASGIFKFAMAITVGAMAGTGASSALNAIMGSAGSAASGAAIGSAISQGIATGEVDLRDVLVAAATAGIGEYLTSYLQEAGVLSNAEEQANRYLEIADQYAQNPAFGTSSTAYQAAMENYNRLTQGLEAASNSSNILNWASEAGWLAGSLENLQENSEEMPEIEWQDVSENPDLTVQIPDYRAILEETEGGGGGDDSGTGEPSEDGDFEDPNDSTIDEDDPFEEDSGVDEEDDDTDMVGRQIYEAILNEQDPDVQDSLIGEWERYTEQTWDDAYFEESPYEELTEEDATPEIVGYYIDPMENTLRIVYEGDNISGRGTLYGTPEEAWESFEQNPPEDDGRDPTTIPTLPDPTDDTGDYDGGSGGNNGGGGDTGGGDDDGGSGDGDGDGNGSGDGDGNGSGDGDGEGDGDGDGDDDGGGFPTPPPMGGAGRPFQGFNSGISWQNPGLLNVPQYNPTDATGQLSNMLGRLKQKRGMFNR